MATIRATTTENESVVTFRHMLPIISASTIGTSIEWFDFFFYGFLAVTVFPSVFFPRANPIVGILTSISANFVGFAARPLGGAFFGWFGDRIGRKSTLAATLLLMGSATICMGILPGYATIGVVAPVLLFLLRFLQGIGIGGEWGGSVLLSLEYGDDRRRGFWTSWPQMGVPIGLALAALALLLFRSLFPGDAFSSIGWRIPFFQSSVLLIVGLYIRLRIAETPAFARARDEQRVAKAPLFEAVYSCWREILLSAGARFVEQAPFYIFTTFVITYGVDKLLLDRTLILYAITIAAIVELFTIPLFGYLSDRVGRRLWYLVGCVLMAAFAFPYFLLMNSAKPGIFILAVVLSLGLCHAWIYGPQAALIAERFSPRLRYSGASLGYQLVAPFAGGLSPIIAAYVLANYKSFAGGSVAAAPPYLLIALYIILMSALSLIATQLLKEYAGRPTA